MYSLERKVSWTVVRPRNKIVSNKRVTEAEIWWMMDMQCTLFLSFLMSWRSVEGKNKAEEGLMCVEKTRDIYWKSFQWCIRYHFLSLFGSLAYDFYFLQSHTFLAGNAVCAKWFTLSWVMSINNWSLHWPMKLIKIYGIGFAWGVTHTLLNYMWHLYQSNMIPNSFAHCLRILKNNNSFDWWFA